MDPRTDQTLTVRDLFRYIDLKRDILRQEQRRVVKTFPEQDRGKIIMRHRARRHELEKLKSEVTERGEEGFRKYLDDLEETLRTLKAKNNKL